MLRALIIVAALYLLTGPILIGISILSVVTQSKPEEPQQQETTRPCPPPTEKDRNADGSLTLDYLLQVC